MKLPTDVAFRSGLQELACGTAKPAPAHRRNHERLLLQSARQPNPR